MRDFVIRCRSAVAVACRLGALTLLTPALAQAALVNGDFSDGLNGWNLSLTTLDVDGFTLLDVPYDPSAPEHVDRFSIAGGELRLNPDDEFFELVLFQDFILDPGTTDILFTFSYGLSNPDPDFGDLVQVQLFEQGGAPILPEPTGLLDGLGTGSGPTPAQRSLAFLGGATDVTLEIVITDFDFFAGPDFLSIGNFSFLPATPGADPVPAPATLVLCVIGLLFAGAGRRRRRRSRGAA